MINTTHVFKLDLSLINKRVDGFNFFWTVPVDLPYFDGHFPKNPILPAVAFLDLIIQLFSVMYPNTSVRFKSIKSAKFTAMVRPNDIVKIQFNFDADKSLWTSSFNNEEDELTSKIKFYFDSPEISPTML